MRKILARVIPAALLGLSACKTGPDYQRPAVETPADWRWKVAQPSDHADKGEWWRIFAEPRLDAFQAQAAGQNQDLRAATARVEQARAAARISRSEFFPSLTSTPSFSRYRTSGNAPTPFGFAVPSFTDKAWSVPFDLTYELDVWGKVRRSFEASRHLAIGAAAARQNVLLTLQADVAANYFILVGLNAEITTLEEAIRLREEALQVFKQRLEAGVGTDFEVERTKVELATAQADLAAARLRKAQTENALAVLCGKAPSDFTGEAAVILPPPPEIAPDLPSSLLERRPDIAEAEREMAARNAEIGAAKAAYFPSIRLTANGGLQSGDLKNLFKWESRVWTISPSIHIPIFEQARLKAEHQRAKAAYEEAVAEYRQKTLVAFREVDDSLAALRFLKEQSAALEVAVVAARNSSRIAFDRFSAGTVNFLEVVDAESARLQNELARIRILTEQLNATVRLVKALGGGWQ